MKITLNDEMFVKVIKICASLILEYYSVLTLGLLLYCYEVTRDEWTPYMDAPVAGVICGIISILLQLIIIRINFRNKYWLYLSLTLILVAIVFLVRLIALPTPIE